MADERKVNLRVGVDGSDVKAGLNEIKNDVREAAQDISKSAEKAGNSVGSIGDKAAPAGAKVDGAARSIIGAIERATASMKAGEKGTAAYFETLGAQRGVSADLLKPYLEQLRAVEAAQKSGKGSSEQWAAAAQRAGISQAQFTAALRGTPAQISDIVVSLQGGMNPMTVFMQQGFQLRDMFNGWRPAAEALTVSLLKMVTPWTVAGAAVGVFAYQAYQAEQRLQKLNGLQLQFGATGRDLGVTELDGMIKRIALLPGLSKTAATEMVGAFAPVREIGRTLLEPLLSITNDYAAATGRDATAAAKALADAFRNPEEGAKSLNRELGFLSAEQSISIEKFLEQGRIAEAQGVLLDALTVKVKGLAREGMTPLAESSDALAKSWGRLKESFSNTETLTETNRVLADIVGKVAWLIDSGAKVKPGLFGLPDLRQSAGIDALIGIPARNTGGATGGWESDTPTAPTTGTPGKREQQAWQDYVTNLLDATKQYKATRDEADKLRETLGRLREAQKKESDAGNVKSAAELAERIAGVQEKIKGLDKKGASEGQASAYGRLGIDIERIKGEYEQLANIYSHSEKVMEMARKSGAISEAEYYTAKRGFIRLNADAKEQELEAEIARYQTSNLSAEKSLEVQKKVATAESALKTARMDRSLKIAELDAQEEAATRAKTSALQSYRQAAQDAYDTTSRAYSRDVQTAWLGGNASRYAQGQSQVEERSAQMRREAMNQLANVEILSGGKLTADQRKQYEDRLAIISEFQVKALASYETYYEALRAGERDWTNGAQRAFANYLDGSANVASQTEGVFTKAFTGMEDALVNFAMTGKLSFSSMANSIIADIIRMQVRASMTGGGSGGLLGSLMNGVMGMFGAGAPVGAAGNAGYGDYSAAGLRAAYNFATGGFTGFGGKYEPAGIVHKGEYVIRKESTEKLGLGFLNRLNNAANGYANGGLVGGSGAGAALAGVERIELINKIAPGEVTSVETLQGEGGGAVLRIVIEKAANAAVAAISNQAATRRGPFHQALLARERS